MIPVTAGLVPVARKLLFHECLCSSTAQAAVLYCQVGAGWVPGYTATALLIIFFGGLNSLGIGLLGEYVWRAFENTKGRPSYIVARHVEFDAAA